MAVKSAGTKQDDDNDADIASVKTVSRLTMTCVDREATERDRLRVKSGR